MNDHWTTRYRQRDYVFGTEADSWLQRCRHRLPPQGRALAVADGEGRNGVWLAEQGLCVVSLDQSPVAQQKAVELARRHGVELELVHADVGDWLWPEATFDVIACLFLQLPTPARTILLRNMVKALSPGGLIIFRGFHRRHAAEGTAGPRQPDVLYDDNELKHAFAELEIEHLTQATTRVRASDQMNGQGITLECLARKSSSTQEISAF